MRAKIYITFFLFLFLCYTPFKSQNVAPDSVLTKVAKEVAIKNNLKGAEYIYFLENYGKIKSRANIPHESLNEDKVAITCGSSSGNNIGFELNNYSDWTFYGGNNVKSIPDSTNFTWATGTKTLVTGGIDAITSVSLTSPLGGNVVIKINDDVSTGDLTAMKTRFKVTPTSSLLKTAFSLVLANAAHQCDMQPYFKIQILSCDESTTLREYYSMSPESACKGINPFNFIPIGTTAFYTPWKVVCFDLSEYVGQYVNVKVIASDCGIVAHYGYAYFDATLSAASPNTISNTLTVNSTNYPFNSNFSSVCFSNPALISAPLGASTYSWSTPSGTTASATYSTTTSGYYSLAMSNPAGCLFEKHYLIGVKPIMSIVPSATGVCSGQNFSLTASGGLSHSWQWPPSGFSTQTVLTTSINTNTTYTLVGYNGNSCYDTLTQIIVQYPNPILGPIPNGTVCIGSSITVTVSGASTYTWSNGSLGNSAIHTPTAFTTYNVIGESTFGCLSSPRYFSINTIPTSTNLAVTAAKPNICVGDSTLITATGGITYSWSPGPTTNTIYVKPTSTSIYTVTANMLCGVLSKTVLVTVNSSTSTLNVTAPSTVCSFNTFTASSTGAVTYTYNFGTSVYVGNIVSASISSTVSSFTVTGTDVGGCRSSTIIPISVSPSPTLSILKPPYACVGQVSTFSVSGPDTYNWYLTSNTTTPIGTGTSIAVSPTVNTGYTAQAIDLLGCKTQSAFTFSVEKNTFTISSTTNTMCLGNSITLSGPTNFISPITYSWDNGATTSTISVSPTVTTTYTLDINNTACGLLTATKTITVIPFYNPTVTISASSNTCCVNSVLTLSASGATTYQWFNGSGLTTVNVSNTGPTSNNYYVIGTDANGCKTMSPFFNVTYIAYPSLAITGPSLVCAGQPATLTVSGASTYSWSTSSTSNSIIVNPGLTTTYSVIGDNFSGCLSSISKIVYVQAYPTLSLSTNANSVCPGGQAMLNAASSSAVTYTWSTGSNYDTTYVNPTTTTIYTVTCKTSIGCSTTKTISIGVITPAPLTLGVSTNTICAYSGVPIILSPSPATGFYTTPGVTSNTIYPYSPGVYSVSYKIATSPCGNVATAIFTVVPNQCVILSASPDTLCSGQVSTLSYTPSGGSLVGPFLSGNLFSPTAPGSYSVTYNYTDSYGCSYSDCNSIFVNVCTNIKETGLESVNVYPNPFTNEFTINNPNSLELNITVYDLNGKLIQKYSSDKTSKLNSENYSDGIYYLHISSKEFSKFVKLIKL